VEYVPHAKVFSNYL